MDDGRRIVAGIAVLAGLVLAAAGGSAVRGPRRVVKIDDYPVYSAVYQGDYGFAGYLKTGVKPSFAAPASEGAARPVSCTVFAALGGDGPRRLGRNFDWHDVVPLVLFTRPADGYASASMVSLEYFGFHRGRLPDRPEDRAALQGAPYWPFDGMNEKGLAVGLMAVPAAEAPFDAAKVTIGEIEAIRLLLDYAADVDEAVALLSSYNIRMENPPVHYLAADRSGRSVIVEFVAGRMIVQPNPEPWQVATNFVLAGSAAPASSPCWRFDRAYRTLAEARGELSESAAGSLLEQVSQADTIWTTLYDLDGGAFRVVPGRAFGTPILFPSVRENRPSSLATRHIKAAAPAD